MGRKKLELTREQIADAIEKHPLSMYQASVSLGVTYTSFIRYAKLSGLYRPNPSGKGVSKPWRKKVDLADLLVKGKFRNTGNLKKRLFTDMLKQEQCEECGQLPMWNGKKLVLHLDHIDGNASNNLLTNLRILCPNCHTQTHTYCRGQGKQKLNTLVVER